MKKVSGVRLIVAGIGLLAAMAGMAASSVQKPMPGTRAHFSILSAYLDDETGHVIAVSETMWPKSGPSYSKYEVDCLGQSFRYLASGSTPEDLKIPRPDPRMTALVEGSASFWITMEACRQVGNELSRQAGD
ncbi:hypothetical protein ACEK07_04485 [Alcanivoracaceae bacterium MT1]